mmetsp:Transcript_22159/g.36642  ORF Transcript_22159/g.36642 Transcript_22159/m.36642 type:complete len:170 (+) Transcript_22159:558-1067(+)
MQKLSRARSPVMLLHSKALASLGHFASFFAARYTHQLEFVPLPLQQLILAVANGSTAVARKGEWLPYSPRVLAGFCAMLNENSPSDGYDRFARQLVLNSNGSGTTYDQLQKMRGAVGVLLLPRGSNAFECKAERGTCGVRSAVWPSSNDPSVPKWYWDHRASHRASHGS